MTVNIIHEYAESFVSGIVRRHKTWRHARKACRRHLNNDIADDISSVLQTSYMNY